MKFKIFFILFCMVFLIGSVSAVTWDNIGYWDLDETTGTTAEDSTGSYNGTANNARVFTSEAEGIINTCADFTQGTDDILIGEIGTYDIFTLNLWVKFSSTTHEHRFLSDGNTYYFRVSSSNYLSARVDGHNDRNQYDFSGDINTDDWFMITFIADSVTNLVKVYVNGEFKGQDNSSFSAITFSALTAFAKETNEINNLSGYLDEIGIWNRSLTAEEVIELYNLGNGLEYGGEVGIGITVTLNSPSDGTSTSITSQLFNATGTPTDTNITNATIKIWYLNGTLFYNETNLTLIENEADYLFNLSNFSVGDYEWNVEMCGNEANCTSATSNYTFSWIPFTNEGESYDGAVFETSRQTFAINISTDEDWTVSNGRLIYNGTTYGYATKTDLGSGDFHLTHTINIPIGEDGFSSENRSFYWNITLTEIATGTTFSSTTTEHNQTVNEIILKLCGGSATNSTLNFTMIDEELGTEINATKYSTTFQATFEYGLDSTYLEKNYSIDNITVGVSQFDFCMNNETLTPYVNMEAYYTANSFIDKNYYLNNASLNASAEEEINLYLLNESNALEFFISVTQDLSPITSASVNIKKYFVGEGVYKTVEIDETSSDSGEFTAYLDLDKDYKFTISRGQTVLGTVTKTASCKEAPCELTLSLRSGLSDIYSAFSSQFGQDVVYNLSWNPNTKIVTFDFIDTTGLADHFRMIIYKGNFNTSSSTVYDTSMYTSSGTMTANLSAYDDGYFTAEVYVSRSPEILIDYIKFILNENVAKFGLLGLFFAFLLVITIIFGFSFSPSFLVFAIPLSLTVAAFIGISVIGQTGIIVTYILAIIAAFAMRN